MHQTPCHHVDFRPSVQYDAFIPDKDRDDRDAPRRMTDAYSSLAEGLNQRLGGNALRLGS